MRLSRRTLVFGLAATSLAGQATKECVWERRVYAAGSDVPPPAVLRRNGIHVESIRHTQRGAEYLIAFDSLASRSRAWDRFNTDPAWCAIRGQGNVRLHEIVVIPD